MFGMNSLFAGYQARLYWFDWQKLSASGHSSYGRYVYERLLDALQQADFSLPRLTATFSRELKSRSGAIKTRRWSDQS